MKRLSIRTLILFLVGLSLGLNATAAQDSKGQRLYVEQCASCHGKQGEGGDGFDDPLIGDLSLKALTQYIDQSMPEGEPQTVTGEDARLVASYVFEQFYSEDAQARNAKPVIQLAHLTVDQHRNAIADLVGSLGKPARQSDQPGLKASYYAARRQTRELQIATQIDPQIDFADAVPHFDPTGKYESVPKPKKKPANQMNVGFSAYWYGGLRATETGRYRIKVKSKNGFKLFVNDPVKPLIDRYVRSDEVVDHTAEIFLLGGRTYNFRLDFFSYPNPPAKIQLLWQPPGGIEEVIPASAYYQEPTNEVLVIDTEFPADDASAGYERGINVSAQWDRATTEAAIQAAEWISSRIGRLAKIRPGEDEAKKKAQTFCEALVAKAFVTDLKAEDVEFYVGQHFATERSIEDQVRRVVLLTLKSPRFLFRTLEDRSSGFQRASELAEILWDSLPDDQLYQAASRDRLAAPQSLANEMQRMADDFRGQQKLRRFFDAWLDIHVEALNKDPKLFPEFDQQLISDLRTSLQMQIERTVTSESSDFRQLLQSDYLYANQRLAEFYGLERSSDSSPAAFTEVAIQSGRGGGLLTHPYLMASLAYHDQSSPIHRGVFVAKQLLGRRLRQPPNNVKPLSEEFAPEMTNRQRVEFQTKESACMNCHSIINPLGFSFENFDAVGRFREQEDSRPIDTVSKFQTREGTKVELRGAEDLAKFIVEDRWAQRNFVRQLFRFYVKQPIEAYEPGSLDRLHRKFVEQDFSIRSLTMEIARLALDASRLEGNDTSRLNAESTTDSGLVQQKDEP